MKHDENCPKPLRGECLKFSTDGTRLGADIAHTMGTDSEQDILALAERDTFDVARSKLTGMDAEQEDWESDFS